MFSISFKYSATNIYIYKAPIVFNRYKRSKKLENCLRTKLYMEVKRGGGGSTKLDFFRSILGEMYLNGIF